MPFAFAKCFGILIWKWHALSLQEYIQCVKELYKGGLESISFQTAAEKSRELINSWVESQTNGKRKPTISIGIFPSATMFEQHKRTLNQVMKNQNLSLCSFSWIIDKFPDTELSPNNFFSLRHTPVRGVSLSVEVLRIGNTSSPDKRDST